MGLHPRLPGHAPNPSRTAKRVKIRGVVLEQTGGPLTVAELELAAPRAGEVLVRLRASGVCHSDWNAVDGVPV